MKYQGQQQGPAKHLVGFIMVVLFHVVTAYALMSGLARKVIEVVKAPIETKIIEEVKKPELDQPPPPPPKLAPPPPPYIPPPEINIAVQPSTAPSNAITAVTTEKPKAPPPPPAPVVAKPAVRTEPVIDAARSCQKPEYPAASKRMEEEGTVVVSFLINTDGSVLDSKIDQSSGYSRLDQAARSALGKCKFKPGTVDGKPEQSWARIKYTWRLEF